MSVNPMNIIRSLEQYFRRDFKPTTATEEERNHARILRVIIEDIMNSCEIDIEVLEDLDYQDGDDVIVTDDDLRLLDEDDEDKTEECSQGSNSSSQTSEYVPSPELKKSDDAVPFTKKQAVVNYFRDTKRLTHRSLASVQSKYPFVKSLEQIYNWERRLDYYQQRNEKLKVIFNYVQDKFEDAKRNGLVVHDRDIQRWAHDKNNEVKLKNFKASKFWILKFKHIQRITSRKITRFVTKRKSIDDAKVEETAHSFVESVKPLVEAHPDNAVNVDQSGFAMDIHSGRTLDYIGLRHIEVACQSLHNTTHSYTVMPCITASGRLFWHLYMVLQTSHGNLTDRMKKNFPVKATNVVVEASTSGKMGKNHLFSFYEKCLHPHTNEDTLLFEDSWTGFSDEILQQTTPAGKGVEVAKIPPKTTGKIQPLDKFYLRMYKSFVRYISDYTLAPELKIDMKKKEYIVKIHSLSHFQFGAPIFRKMIQYAWHASGFLDEHPGPFQTPMQYCFDTEFGTCAKCDKVKFIKCAWCSNFLCFEHFYTSHHMCHEPT